MAQLHRHPQPDTCSKAPPPSIATVEQLLRGGESSKVSPTSSSSGSFERSKQRDTEEDHSQLQKKSVLTKVKEKAKKLRHSLSKKKHDDGNLTPTMGEDEQDDEDTEYLGAPMYESELAPERYRERARQHPRAIPVISEKHVLPCSVKSGVEPHHNETPLSPSNSKRVLTTTPQHHPEYTVTPSFTSKFQGLSISKPTELHTSSSPSSPRKDSSAVSSPKAKRSGSQTYYDASMPPRVVSAPLTPQNSLSDDGVGRQVWDKGVSVKEYLMNKFEPGEDERALSQVISEAMSPKNTPHDKGVMEKVKDAVTYFLRNDDPSQNAGDVQASLTNTTTSSSEIPVSTNAYEVVEEENKGRILQAN